MSTVTEEKISLLYMMTSASSSPVIVTHTRPDGDAMGSSVAFLHFLEGLAGKKGVICTSTPCPDAISFIVPEADRSSVLNRQDAPEDTEAAIAGADLIICLDCAGFSRTDALESLLRASGAPKVLIDHHLAPDAGAFDLVFSDTEVSSTCELLYNILKMMPQVGGCTGRLPSEALDALMAGLTTDTNNFANSVFPGTLPMAGELIDAGVDRDVILSSIYQNYRENRYRLMGWLLYNEMKLMPCGTAYIILTKDLQDRFGFIEGETEGIVNIPLGIASVRMSVLLTEDDGFFRVSVRSKKGTSANLWARQYFNGGGHEQAAGGRLYIPRDIQDRSMVEDYLKDAADEFLR